MIERHPIDVVNNREEWLALRRRDVTASVVGVVCGAHKFKSPLHLYNEKIGAVPEEEETDVMRRGRWMEDAVLTAVRERHPEWSIVKPQIYLRDPKIRIGATPDAIAVVPGEDRDTVLQCKVVNQRTFDADWDDGPPLQYQLQTLTELHLWGGKRAYVCALVDSGFKAHLEMFEVGWHPAAFEVICEKVKDFWKAAEAGEEPPADYAMDLGLVKFLYPPKHDGPPLDLARDNRMAELLPHREDLQAAAKRIKDELKAIDAEIIDKLRGASLADCPDGYRVTYRTINRKGYAVPDTSFAQLRIVHKKEAA